MNQDTMLSDESERKSLSRDQVVEIPQVNGSFGEGKVEVVNPFEENIFKTKKSSLR